MINTPDPNHSVLSTEINTQIKNRFSKLSDESIASLKGNLDLLVAKLQTGYGYAKEQAEKELASFKASLEEKETQRKPL